jgi:FemAB-related protein (PEP-CTERM system-associated)
VIAVRPFTGDALEWDAYVERTPGATYCHLSGWRDIMSAALGHECFQLVATDEHGATVGALPLVRVRSPLLGHYLVSMPFLNSGGPLGTPDAERALVDWAVREAQRSGADLLELRSRRMVESAPRQSNRKITVQLPLPDTSEKLWAAFPSKLRSQIKKPMKAGYETRFGTAEREPFYEVYARTMHRLGTPALPAALFERVASVLPGIVEFGAVYLHGVPVAAGCGFTWRGEFELQWAGALSEHNRDAPNMLLYWSFMERMIAAGVRVFDFGRCTPGGGTHGFKRQWGGSDVALPWGQWSPKNVTATPSPERPLFRFASNCWKQLPHAFVSRVGPLIATRLP